MSKNFFMMLLLLTVAGCGRVAPATPQATDVPTLPSPSPTAVAVPSTVTVVLPSLAAILEATEAPSPTPEAVQLFETDLNFAQVQFVTATQGSDGRWRFDATVHHNDQGWDHYANAWQVVDMDGTMLAERILAHPHDTEQPFVRSQGGVTIPPEITRVIVKAQCNVHGFGGQEVLVDLTSITGENFEVVR